MIILVFQGRKWKYSWISDLLKIRGISEKSEKKPEYSWKRLKCIKMCFWKDRKLDLFYKCLTMVIKCLNITKGHIKKQKQIEWIWIVVITTVSQLIQM